MRASPVFVSKSWCSRAKINLFDLAQPEQLEFYLMKSVPNRLVMKAINFLELSTNLSRKQFETLTEQVKELAMLAQKVALTTAEPIKAGATKAFSQLS